jgi:hypothetical protein
MNPSDPAPNLPPATVSSIGRLVAWALGAGLLAGVASWLIGEAAFNAFRPPYQAQHVMGQVIMKATFADQSAADSKNATLAFAVLGGLLGIALGMVGGLARQSARAGAVAAAAGLVLGGVLGAVASWALLPVYFHALAVAQEALSRDLTLPLLVHGGIWAACGLAGGVAFGIGLGGGRAVVVKAGFGGLLGAILGAALYELIGASVFPAQKTTSPLSTTWGTRLLARLLVCSLSAMLAAALVNLSGRRPAGASQSSRP